MGEAKRRGSFEERRDLAQDMANMRRAQEDAKVAREDAERQRANRRNLGGGTRGLVLAAAALAMGGVGIVGGPVRE